MVFLLAWYVAWSGALVLCSPKESTPTAVECYEPVVTQCKCGSSGNYQDFYVESCQAYSEDNSSSCGPCPGSCNLFLFCKTCSKSVCHSCPDGRWGLFCEKKEIHKSNHSNPTEFSEDVKSHAQGSEKNLDDSSLKLQETIPFKNRSSERFRKPKDGQKSGKNKNDQLLSAFVEGTVSAATERNPAQYYNVKNKEKEHYREFDLHVNTEISHSYSNKTESLTSIQKANETFTVMNDSLKKNDEEFLTPVIKLLKETKDQNDKFTNANDLITYGMDYTTLSVSDSPPESINLSKRGDNFKASKEETFDKKLDGSSIQLRNPLESSEVHGNANFEEFEMLKESTKQRMYPPEVHVNSNLEELKKKHNSLRQWKHLPVYQGKEKANLETHNFKLDIVENFAKENGPEDSLRFYKTEFSLKDINFPPLSFLYRENKFNLSKSQNKSHLFSNNPKISNQEKMIHRPTFVLGKSDPEEINITLRLNNKNSELSKKPNLYNNRIVDAEANSTTDDAEFTNTSKNIFEGNKSSKSSKDRILKFLTNTSKEYDFFSPLESTVFKITFLNEDDRNSFRQNSNSTERRKIRNGEDANASETSPQIPLKQTQDITVESDAVDPLNASVFIIKLQKESANASSEEQKYDSKLIENKAEAKTKAEGFNYEINATNQPHDEFQYGDATHSNLTESKLIENYKIAPQTSQNKAPGLPQNVTIKSEANTPLKDSVLKETLRKYYTKKKVNEKEENTKEKTANYKRNATNKPQGELRYDMDVLLKLILHSPDFTTRQPNKSNNEQLLTSHSFRKSKISENNNSMALHLPHNSEQYRNSVLDHTRLKKLCDVYPIYSPCFRIPILEPKSAYSSYKFGFQSQLHPKINHLNVFPNRGSKYHSPKLTFDSFKSNMHSYALNGQQQSRDLQILDPAKQYWQLKSAQITLPLLFQNLESPHGTFTSKQSRYNSPYIQDRNQKLPSEERFDSSLMIGIINHLLSFLIPKYQSDNIQRQELYEGRPKQSVSDGEIDSPLDVTPFRQARFFPGPSNQFISSFRFPDTYLRNSMLGDAAILNGVSIKSGNEPNAKSDIMNEVPIRLNKSSEESSSQSTFLKQKNLFKENPLQSEETYLTENGKAPIKTGFFSDASEDNAAYFKNRMLGNRESVEFPIVEFEPESINPDYKSIRFFFNIPSRFKDFSSNSTQLRDRSNETLKGSIEKRRIEEANYTSNDIRVCNPKFVTCIKKYFPPKLIGSTRKESLESEKLPKAIDTKPIKITYLMPKEVILENKTAKVGDTLLDSCARCKYEPFRPIYEPDDKAEKTLPSIFRALIVEEGSLLGNQSVLKKPKSSRSKRGIYSYGPHNWCPIQRTMLNGDLECTIWSYQKVCKIRCHPGYTIRQDTFKCSRKTNAWSPKLLPCERTKSNLGYRQGNDPFNTEDANKNTGGTYNDESAHYPLADSQDFVGENPEYRNKGRQVALRKDRSFNNGQDFIAHEEMDEKDNFSSSIVQNFPGDEASDGKEIPEHNDQNFSDKQDIFSSNNSQRFAIHDVSDRKDKAALHNIQVFTGDRKAGGRYPSFEDAQDFPRDRTKVRKDNYKYNNDQETFYEPFNGKDSFSLDNDQVIPRDIAATNEKVALDFSDDLSMDSKGVQKESSLVNFKANENNFKELSDGNQEKIYSFFEEPDSPS